MKDRFRLLPACCAVLAGLGLVRPAAAQECVGLPSGRGVLSVGFEGTDGATGQGLSFAYQTRNAALMLQHRSLDVLSLVDEMSTSEGQVSLRLPSGPRLPVCATVGLQTTAYRNDYTESTSWTSGDPDHEIQRNRIGGPYSGLRVPLGVSMGREFRVSDRMAVVPFLQPTVVFQGEHYQPQRGPEETRNNWGLGLSGGVTAAFDWLVLRSTVTHTTRPGNSLSTLNDWPTVSLHAGVRF